MINILILFFISILLTGCFDNTIILPKKDEIVIHFIDVGHGEGTTHGDAIFIDTNDKDILIDGGERDQAYRVKRYIDKLGIKKIDYIVATHAHPDHYEGLIRVMQNYQIGEVWFNGVSNAKTALRFDPVMKKHRYEAIKKGKHIQLSDNVEIEVLHPFEEFNSNDNDMSIVIKLVHNKISFLLTGDCTEKCNNELLKSEYDLKSDILKVGHHCNKESVQLKFLKAVNPKIAVTTPGSNDKYNKPHPECLQRLDDFDIKIYRTDKEGNIAIVSDGNNYNVLTSKISVF